VQPSSRLGISWQIGAGVAAENRDTGKMSDTLAVPTAGCLAARRQIFEVI